MEVFVSLDRCPLNSVSSVTSPRLHLHRRPGTTTAILMLYITGMVSLARVSSASALAHASRRTPSSESLVVQGQVHVPPQYLSNLRLTLNGGLLSVAPCSSGTFEIGPVRPGSYLLQPSHPLLHLSSYLIKVPTSASEALEVFALGDSFRPVLKMSLPLVIAPLGLNPPVYFAIKPPFSLLVLLQQPLLLVAIACCALMWCLPRLQQYQEEDERQHRAALLQQQDVLAHNNFPRGQHADHQERYSNGGRTTPPGTSWRGHERGRYRADVDQGADFEEELTEEYAERSAFAKCLASIHPAGRSHSLCTR